MMAVKPNAYTSIEWVLGLDAVVPGKVQVCNQINSDSNIP